MQGEFSLKSFIEFFSSFILIVGWMASIVGIGILMFLLFVSIGYGYFANLYWPLGLIMLGLGLLFIWASKRLVKTW